MYLLFTGLFMFLAISAKMNKDKQLVNDVVIKIDHTSGNFFITEQDVMNELYQVLPDSGTIIRINDLITLEEKLEKLAQIKESNVFVDKVGHLTIDVKQRQPIYRVIMKNMKSFYVDQEGNKFPTSDKYTANVPIVTGFIADNGSDTGLIQTDLCKEVMVVMEELLQDEFLKAQFGQVDITDIGEIELIPRVGDHIVQLGDSKNIKDKLSRLKIFYEEGLKTAGWNTYKTITLKYKDQVVCKK